MKTTPNPTCLLKMLQGFRASGLQGFRASGLQGFRASGLQVARSNSWCCEKGQRKVLISGWLVIVSLCMAGCDKSPPALPVDSPSGSASAAVGISSQPLKRIDLGIIDYQLGGYVCLPLSELGIEKPDQIVGLKTSCECTTASLIEFVDFKQQVASALRLDIAGEDSTGETAPNGGSLIERWTTGADAPKGAEELPQPRHLAVEVSVAMASGKSHQLTVRFVQTPTGPSRIGGES